jgi:hypothetical protein
MSDSSMKILTDLRQAKEQVKRLEAEYSKVCDCNQRIPGTESQTYNVYARTHRTCSYHEVRVTYNAKV